MRLLRATCFRQRLGWALLIALPGCAPAVAPAVVPVAVAPVRKAHVTPESLPAVKFIDITKDAGISFVHHNGALGAKLLPETMGAGVAFLDYDRDGDQDLFFVNSSYWPGHETKPAPTQALYRNDGKGHFQDVTKEAGLDKTFYGMGVAVGDFDNDNDVDLYVTAISRGYLFRNDGKGHFEDVTEASGAKGPHGWLTGAAFLDIDNDGDLDLFIGNYISWTPEIDKVQGFQLTGIGRAYGPPTSFSGSFCALLRNDGGQFTDISELSGIQVRTPDLKVPVGKSLGLAPYDVDGDGWVDIAVANDTVQNFLFHNTGHGKFEEIAIIAGVAFDQSGSARGGMGMDWATFINDECGYDLLLMSAVNDVSRIPTAGKKLIIVAVVDHVLHFRIFDGDSEMDLDTDERKLPEKAQQIDDLRKQLESLWPPHELTKSEKDREISAVRSIVGHTHERLGLAVGNFANEMTALYVCDQPSILQFSDLANLFGLGAPTQPPLKFGLFFFDYDLDGRLDLLSANGHLEPEIAKVQASETYPQPAQLFWNSGQSGRGLYVLVEPENAGPDLFKPVVGRGTAYADIDGDGDLDVVLTVNNGPARLFRNDGGNQNHWLRLELTGNGKTSNRDAFGAKVELKVGDSVCHRQLFPAKSYLSSVEFPLTFGLGKADQADEITITWPSRKVMHLKDLKAGKTYRVDEDGGLKP